MVPTLRCGLVRSNFCLPIPSFLLLRGRGVDELRCDQLRDFLVAIELHGERGPALRRRAQVGCVTEHRRQGHAGSDRLRVAARLEALDAPSAGVEVTHDVTEVLLRSHDLDGHDRLEQLRLRTLHRLLEGHRAGDLERHLARVDLVVGAVDELDADVDDRVAGEDARLHRLLDAEVDRGDVFARYLTADNLVRELVALAGLRGLRVDDRVAVLAAAAGLTDEPAFDLLDRAPERLAVGDLRAADVRVHRELAQEAIDDDLEMELAHARDQGLAGFLVAPDAEGRVLLRQALQARRELVLVGLRLRLDRDGDDGIREVHRLEPDRGGVDRERVTGRRGLEADRRGDLAGADLVALLAVVRMHLEDPADPLRLAGGRVHYPVAGLDLAGVDAKISQLADVRVRHHLEDERREGLVVRRPARELVLGTRIDPMHGRDVERAGQVVRDRVDQLVVVLLGLLDELGRNLARVHRRAEIV